MNRWLLRGVSVLALVGVLATLMVGTALAQAPGPEQAPPGAERPRAGAVLVHRMSEATGLPAEAIVGQLQSGQTPREILEQHGVDADAFVADALADLEVKLDEAVANGRIDEAREDEILANAEQRLTAAMDRTYENIRSGGGNRPLRPRVAALRGFVGKLLEASGLTQAELLAELRAGQSPAEILQANGVSVDAFTAEVLSDLEVKLDEAVTAGNMDPARAEQILSQAEQRLPEALKRTFGAPAAPSGENSGVSSGGLPGEPGL